MCMILHRPAGAKIPDDLLEASEAINHHGAGLMWVDDGRFEVRRTMDYRRLQEWISHVPKDVDLSIHHRLATQGVVGKKNCHPFKVTSEIYVMHNGILPLYDPMKQVSDTALFAKHILRPLLESNPDLFWSDAFNELIKLAAAGDKFLFQHVNGKIVFINKARGEYIGDVWVSSNPFSWVGLTRKAGNTSYTHGMSSYWGAETYDGWENYRTDPPGRNIMLADRRSIMLAEPFFDHDNHEYDKCDTFFTGGEATYSKDEAMREILEGLETSEDVYTHV